MPSPAAQIFSIGMLRARTLYTAVASERLYTLQQFDAQIFYHAALTAIVAAWDAYLNEVVINFYTVTANPIDISYNSIFEVAQKSSLRASKKFNTPNWNNARNFLIETIGYDPINDWIWPRRRMGIKDIEERINQILKIRHSFAHGFDMPSYSWNTTPNGRVRLTVQVLRDAEALFLNLVGRTDRGLSYHIHRYYDRVTSW